MVVFEVDCVNANVPTMFTTLSPIERKLHYRPLREISVEMFPRYVVKYELLFIYLAINNHADFCEDTDRKDHNPRGGRSSIDLSNQPNYTIHICNC